MLSWSFFLSLTLLFDTALTAFLAEQATKGKKAAKAMLRVVVVLNLAAGVAILINSTHSAEEQAKTLRKMSDDQTTTIKKANELTDNLNEVAKTLQATSATINGTATTIKDVLSETRRGLQPLETLGILFSLKLPGDDPEVAKTLADYRQSTNGSPPLDVDVRNYLLTAPMKSLGFVFAPNMPNYPKRETALGLVTRSYRVNMQFHLQHHQPAAFASDHKPQPDLAIDFVEDASPQTFVTLSRWLEINNSNPSSLLYVLRSSVNRNSWHTNGRILSVTDLLKSQVVAQPTFAVPPVEEAGKYQINKRVLQEASDIWSALTLDAIVLSTQDGRRWSFSSPKGKPVTQYGVPIFVGQFDHQIKPLEGR